MESVTILVGDVSNNALGRAYLLGQLMQHRVDVALVGPAFGDGTWAPLADADLPIQGIPARDVAPWSARTTMRRVAKQATGDYLYVAKPFATTMKVALDTQRPTALDVDDWEMGFVEARRARRGRLFQAVERVASHRGIDPRRTWSIERGDAWIRRFPIRTVSNRFLEERYGGHMLWHARDTDVFDPAHHDRATARRALGFDDEIVVLFQGTPRAHKGIDDVVESCRDLDVTLLVVGMDETTYCHELRARATAALGDRFKALPMQPFDAMPSFLAAADIVALPQRDGSATVGQMPAKVFDAMAMARPVVATHVSDLPEVLEGCGVIVAPGDAKALRDAIAGLAADPAQRQALGEAARQRCIDRYSHHAARKTMDRVIDALESA